MIRGLYAAVSAMLAGLNQQSLLAHNIANIDTPGFKQALASQEDFVQVAVTQSPTAIAAGRPQVIGSLGLGVETGSLQDDFGQGALQYTGQSLDLALQGPGFFRIQTGQGERYTRDGRFMLDTSGQLVSVDGHRVLDEAGQPITLPKAGRLTVSSDGSLFVDGKQVGRLGLAAFENLQQELARDLPNAFSASGQPGSKELGVVLQGYLESSNVNAAQTMTQMVQVARSYEAAQQMVQNEDELLGKAIATLGRL